MHSNTNSTQLRLITTIATLVLAPGYSTAHMMYFFKNKKLQQPLMKQNAKRTSLGISNVQDR